MSRSGCPCPECGSRDTRIHMYQEMKGVKLIYYRCKGECGFMWDKGEYAIKPEKLTYEQIDFLLEQKREIETMR